MKISHSFESEGACQFFFLTCTTFKGAVQVWGFFFTSEEDQKEAGLGLREACSVLCSTARSSRLLCSSPQRAEDTEDTSRGGFVLELSRWWLSLRERHGVT